MKKGEIIKNKDGSITILKPSITLPDIHIVPHTDGGSSGGSSDSTPATPDIAPEEPDSSETKYTYKKGNKRLRINQTAANLYLSSSIPTNVLEKIKSNVYNKMGDYRFYGDQNIYVTQSFVKNFGFTTEKISSKYSIYDTDTEIKTEVPLTTGSTFYVPQVRMWDDYTSTALPFKTHYYEVAGSKYIRYNAEKKVWEKIDSSGLIKLLNVIKDTPLFPLETYVSRIFAAIAEILFTVNWITLTRSPIIYLALQGAGGGGARGWDQKGVIWLGPVPVAEGSCQGGDGGGGGAFALVAINGEQLGGSTGFKLTAGAGGKSAASAVIPSWFHTLNQIGAIVVAATAFLRAIPSIAVSVSIDTSGPGANGESSCLYRQKTIDNYSSDNYELLIEAGGGQGGAKDGDGNPGKGGQVTVHKKIDGVIVLSAISGKKGGQRSWADGMGEWITDQDHHPGYPGESYSESEKLDWKFFDGEIFKKSVMLSDGTDSITISTGCGGAGLLPNNGWVNDKAYAYASGGGGGGAAVCSFVADGRPEVLCGYGGGGFGNCTECLNPGQGPGQNGLDGLVAVVDLYDD